MNFIPFKNRTLKVGQRVKLYKNLHNGFYSLQDIKSGLVVGYTDEITLENVDFKVSEKGRERVLREKRKNVHAFIIGDVTNTKTIHTGDNVYYNPYKVANFMNMEKSTILVSVERVNITLDKITYQ